MSIGDSITPDGISSGEASTPPPGGIPVWLASGAVFAIAALFNLYVGLVVFMGDSYLLADRAKHLILAGNLQLNEQLAALIYPPLYAILISPAYLVSEPATSFKLILLIHSFLVACQVWPFYRLLTGYSKLSHSSSLWLAAALALAPFTLPYASMMLTEVAYIPFLLWMTVYFLRFQEEGAVMDGVRTGAFLALMLLCRTAASTVVLSVGGAVVLSLWFHRADLAKVRSRLIAAGGLGLAFGIVFGAWKLYEKLFIHYGNVGGYFTQDDIRIIFNEAKRFDHHFSWLTNTIFYYLTAPLSIVGCFFYSLIFRRLKMLLRDPLFPLAILSLLISAVTVVLVMTQGWGGRDLTWNKYLSPYVFFVIIVSLRYRALFNRSQLRTSALVLSLLFLAFKPSALGCHFTDSLVYFTSNSNPLHMPESVANFVYLAVVFIPAWLWLSPLAKARYVAISITAAVWAISLFGVARVYHNSGDLNISNYAGAAQQALALAKSNPAIQAYYDPTFAAQDFFGALRILFYWPKLVSPLPSAELAAVAAKSTAPIIYFSDKDLGGIKPLAEDRGTVRFYSVTNAALNAAAAALALPPAPGAAAPAGAIKGVFGANVWGTETAVWQGKNYTVRWLGASTQFTIENPGGAYPAVIQMQLSVATSYHSVTLMANGEPAPEKHLITKVLWGHGPQDVAFRVTLKPGRNIFTILSADPLDKLPGGRDVSVLQIGDIRAVPK